MLFTNKILTRTGIFLILLFCSGLLSGQEISQEEKRIHAVLDRIEAENRFVEELTENNLTNLPVGIKRTISGNTIVIGIDSATLSPNGMIISAFTRVVFPGQTYYITFALRGAFLTPAGLSQAGPTRLEMISDFRIKLNNQVTLALPDDGSNYIDWDCYGFRSINLSGLFEFSSDFFLPDDPDKNDRVTAAFQVNTTDLNNILVSTSITPFRIKGLGDMSFTVNNAVADMSDYVNCEGFAMPKDYQLIFPDAPQLWRGFYLKEVSVKLPSELGSSGKQTELSAEDLLIDDFGVSGRFSGTNILTIDQGDASGWPFSIKSLEIGIIQNKIVLGEIAGLMGIPFLGDEPLGYQAQVISHNNELDYTFAIKTTTSKDYPCPFGGTVRLDRGCNFSMKKANGRFIPSAILNGAFYLSGGSAELKGLRFEKLHLITESPYLKGGKFESPGGAGFTIAGFGLSVDSISLAFKQGKAALGLNARVSLMNKTEKGVSASTRFYMNASATKEPGESGAGRLKWTYDNMVFEGIRVKGNVSLFSLYGNVNVFNDHPVYGDAIMGKVGFTAGRIIKDTAMVEIIFGNKPDFRYWFARVEIPTTLPIGTVTLSHLGGGAYSHMERVNLTSTNLNDIGSNYLPNKDAGIGFLADAGLYLKSKNIFEADVMLEIAVNKNGGVRYISFAGEGRFFSQDKEGKSLTDVTASLNMTFDNENNSFHANLRVFMNIANAIRGVGPDDLLGEAVIHSDPKDWYVYIGRPSSPLGVEVLGLLKTQTYFMAGTVIESMPLPPSEVASIISGIDMNFMKNESSLATGRGMAFGIMFKASAGIGKDGGFVYAYLNAGAGADIMLMDYGEARCEGRSGPIGINGWYASGQGYAYLMGKIGIRVKGSEFDIMSVAAALLVQAKMPNPSWFSGNIAARYSVLGGLIKGKVNVKVVLGEECVLITNGNELGGIELIGDISPSTGSSDVDVFSAPQVSFNTTIGKEFGMININDDYAVYKVMLDEFKLFAPGNQEIPGTVEFNPAGDMATLKLRDILPGQQQLNASVKVHIEKKTPDGWISLTGNAETKSAGFSTGDEPKSIPANNVAYSYPLRDQYNFYKSEYPQGYIKLKYGQPNLFNPVKDGINWDHIVRFKSGNQVFETTAVYNGDNAEIRFEIPQNIPTSVAFDMSVIKKPVSSGAVDANLVRGNRIISPGNASDTTIISTSDISGIGISSLESELHTFRFRTSIYNTFSDKVKGISNWKDLSMIDDKTDRKTLTNLLFIKAYLNESFDKYEIEGSGKEISPLIMMEANRGNAWIDAHVFPLIYDLYGTGGLTLSRNPDLLGLFPSRAMFISNLKVENYLLTGSNSNAIEAEFYFNYYVPLYVHYDFYDLLNKAVSLYMGQSPPPQAQRLLAGYLNNPSRGSYPFTLSYRLPGTNLVTFSSNYVIKY